LTQEVRGWHSVYVFITKETMKKLLQNISFITKVFFLKVLNQISITIKKEKNLF